jgi:hypothetical protein
MVLLRIEGTCYVWKETFQMCLRFDRSRNVSFEVFAAFARERLQANDVGCHYRYTMPPM